MIAIGRVAGRATMLASIVARAIARAPVEGAAGRALALAGAAGRVASSHGLVTVAAGPPPPPGALIVANHVSYLDPFALLPLAPAVPLAKAEVGNWPLIGNGARSLGVVLVRRSDPGSRAAVLRGMMRTLAAGVRVLNFPEGTTTEGDRLEPFWRGSFGAARLVGAPIVPVALAYERAEIAWTGGASFLPHYVATAALPSFTCRVLFGEPILPGSASADDLAEGARWEIGKLLERIRHAPTVSVRVPPPRSEPVLPAA